MLVARIHWGKKRQAASQAQGQMGVAPMQMVPQLMPQPQMRLPHVFPAISCLSGFCNRRCRCRAMSQRRCSEFSLSESARLQMPQMPEPNLRGAEPSMAYQSPVMPEPLGTQL